MKRKPGIGLMVLVAILGTMLPASAFTFPEPDWGALLREKEKMVQEADFELYTEAPVESAPYYGAKFEPRGGAYLGSVAETSAPLQPLGSYLTYIDDMAQSDLYYPANKMIREDDVITLVGWTIHDMGNVDFSQVRRTLDALSQYNKPMLIRFANEMNCSSLGDDPDRYIEVFRQVADMIHQDPNFAVVWSPIDLGALDRPFGYFYPGDEYVDWIGVSSYAIKYFQGSRSTDEISATYFMTGDYAWATNRIKPLMEFLQKNNIQKPVMISEGGVATGNRYGENLQAWATPRLRNMLWYLTMKYPQIKMINYFDTHRGSEAEHFDISGHSYAVEIFNEAKNSGAYLTGYRKKADFVFRPANSAETIHAENGMVPLYTLAYLVKQPELTVNYYLDGAWYHAASSIPYVCNLDISNLADGQHTIKISAADVSKEYHFYKKGQSIRFGAGQSGGGASSVLPEEITVTINGEPVAFDQPPVMQNDRTLVPLRAIFEALGATVNWDDATQTVTSVKGDITLTMTIGSKTLHINNTKIELDVPPQLFGSRTLVPARAVAEGFQCIVDWDDATQTVMIMK